MVLVIKNTPANAGDIRAFGLIPGLEKSLEEAVFLPGESHGQRSLASSRPWGRKELDTME